jgi:hypothetical protein
MFAWKRGLCLIGVATFVAACTSGRPGLGAVADPGTQQILMRMQEIVDEGKISNLHLVGQTFGATAWSASTSSGRQSCEANSGQGDRLAFRAVAFGNPARSCSTYLKGRSAIEPGFTYFLQITLPKLPCLRMDDIQSASTRLGWKFELGGGKIGGVPMVQRNGVLRWTAPEADGGKPRSGSIIIAFEGVHERDPALAAKLNITDRCATGEFLLAYS